jgi:rhodanese-related sulfurtransferase
MIGYADMSESEEILTIFKRYWKTLLKWIFDRVNSDQPPVLIDIRGADDYNGVGYSTYGHIPNALSIPILELESHFEDLDTFKEREIVTMCPGGGLSLAAVEILTEAGFKYVKSLKGGTDSWHKKGYPTTTA